MAPQDVTIELLHDKLSSEHFKMRRRSSIFILYESSEFAESLINFLKSDKCREIHIIERPAFFWRTYSHALNSGFTNPHGCPNEVLVGRLYLGSEKHARDRSVLDALGITHIVNATQTLKNEFKPDIKYYRVGVEDAPHE